MTTKSKLKFVQDNPVPAIADAIDSAIQRAIDLQHVSTIGEPRISGWDGRPLDQPSDEPTSAAHPLRMLVCNQAMICEVALG